MWGPCIFLPRRGPRTVDGLDRSSAGHWYLESVSESFIRGPG